MKKANLKQVYAYINQTTEKEVDFESVDLPNNKIKHIIIGNKKVNPPKKQSSMTTKQFQEFVIEFIQEQKLVNQRQEETNKKQAEFNQRQEETNKIILQRLDKIENEIKAIKSCPTIQKELYSD